MVPKILMAGIAMSGLAVILLIVSISTSYWATTYVLTRPDIDIHLGLFKVASSGAEESYDTVPSSLMAVRALVIIGLLGEFAGGCLGILVFVFQRNRESDYKFHLFALMTFALTNLLVLIGCVIFRTTAYKDITETLPLGDGTLGFSFFIAVIGLIAGITSGSLIFNAGKRLASGEYGPMQSSNGA